jgi:hypothetical protein
VVGNPAKLIGFVYKNGERVQNDHLQEICVKTKSVRFIEPSSGEELLLPLHSFKILPV